MKEEIVHHKVLNTILALEVSKGHLRWKVADVARMTKVSRPLIYYHFGKTKKDILKTCIGLIGEDYFGLTKDREKTLEGGDLRTSLQLTRAKFISNPALVTFYHRWRMENSPVRDELVRIERRYQNKIRAAFPAMTSSQVLAFHGLLHGAITAPFLTDDAFEEMCRVILKWLKALRAW